MMIAILNLKCVLEKIRYNKPIKVIDAENLISEFGYVKVVDDFGCCLGYVKLFGGD